MNDVTARELQNKDGQYTRCKGFDTFAPIGPCIAVGLDGRDLQVQAFVNGNLRQDSRTRELIFTIPELVEFISSVMTLLPGDIISTGTPSGIGPIRPGDHVTIHVEGVGALTNPGGRQRRICIMKFFIDSGNLERDQAARAARHHRRRHDQSVAAGEGGGDPREIIKEICQLVQGPVSAEVVATDAPGMITEGRKLAAIDEHVVVKVPFTRGGVEATRALAGEGHRVNVTLIFSPTQALIAAKVGAAYVSPFVGRLDDIASDGMGLIRQIVEIYRHYAFHTEMLVASVRHPMHIVEAARMGADVCTCPPSVYRGLLQASADRHRPREIPEGLGEGPGREASRSQKSEVEVRVWSARSPALILKRVSPNSSVSPSSAAARIASRRSTRPAS